MTEYIWTKAELLEMSRLAAQLGFIDDLVVYQRMLENGEYRA